MSIIKINGVVQNYVWGGTKYIPDLLGITNKELNFAEYWMGAHENAPSIAEETGEKLNEIIQKDPKKILGDKISIQFGKLPFLFKVLDVNDMLSIQVHPTKAEAEKGFRQENEQGIPLSSPQRNYKDDNHKPEIMVALSEFWLLHGFKPMDQLRATLSNTPELKQLLPVFETEGYRGLYKKVMLESIEKTNSVLRPLISRLLPFYEKGKLNKESAEYWAVKAYLTFCEGEDLDKGIYSVFFFNIVKAEPGEAIFQDAGVPHAYMEGQNIELMANSDNVLRGGLTPKHVDVPELLKHVEFTETIPNIFKGNLQSDSIEYIYKSPAPDFELSKLDFKKGQKYTNCSNTLEIMIVVEGKLNLSGEQNYVAIKKGEAFAITADTQYQIESIESAVIYKAKTPS